MPPLSRRTLVKTALAVPATFAILSSRAQAAEFVFKYGNNVPITYPLNVRIREAAARIRKLTNGRFDLQVFPNGELGTDTSMLSQVRTGAIQFFTTSGEVLSTLVPLAALNTVGFAFNDYNQVWPAMDGKVGAMIRSGIDKVGLHAMEKIFDIGFREITSGTHPIANLAALKGFKIRVPPSPLAVSMFKALGAAPGTLNFIELYSALQTHVFDGQENPLSIINTEKFYEVQKYVSMTNHMWDGFWMLCNGPAWHRLPDDVQQVVSRELGRAADQDRQDIASLNASIAGQLKAKGMRFNTPDTAPFRARLKSTGFYAHWRQEFGAAAWHALESYVGPLA